MLKENEIAYFQDEIVPRLDNLYRYYLGIELDEARALARLRQAVQTLLQKPKKMRDLDLQSELFVVMAQAASDVGVERGMPYRGTLAETLAKMPLPERQALMAREAIACPAEQMSALTGVEDWRDALARARLKVLGRESDDLHFLAAYFDDHYAGLMPPEKVQRYDELSLSPDYEALRDALGRFQLKLGEILLPPVDRALIRDLAESPDARTTREMRHIKEGPAQRHATLIRRTVIVAAIIGCLVGLVMFQWRRPAKTPVDLLAAVNYESIALFQEPESRLSFPTSQWEEVQSFVASTRALGLKVDVPKTIPYEVLGASMIDYNDRRLLVFGMRKGAQAIAVYLLRGSLEELPDAPATMFHEMNFRTYESDRFNIIAWQHDPQILGIVVGIPGFATLAEIASAFQAAK